MDLADAIEALGVGGAAGHLLVQRLQLPLAFGVADLAQRQVAPLLGVDEAGHVLVGVAIDEDPPRRGQLLEARGQVHHVADRGVGRRREPMRPVMARPEAMPIRMVHG